MNRTLSTGLLVFVFLLSLCPSSRAEFAPARSFPDTWDRTAVFVDQLPNLTDAQRRFAASHYVGTQKQTDKQIDALRKHNPDFLMLQYRLGPRDSGHTTQLILPDGREGSAWGTDWDDIEHHEDWFEHFDRRRDADHRVYNLYNHRVVEYCMNLDSPGWREFWVNRVAGAVAASHADGVFADSTHLPYAIPASQYNSAFGPPPHHRYIDELERYYDYVYARMTARNLYFIPNIGSLVTTADTTQGYYEDVHGAMVEGYATRRFSCRDWKLQANRTLRLLNNDKIWIAQGGSDGSAAQRMWYLANYLLLKRHRSYVNIGGAGGGVYWWPEYDIDLGPPLDAAKASDPDGLGPLGLVDSLAADVEGVYLRKFRKGWVLVNALRSGSEDLRRVVNLPAGRTFFRVTPSGGGAVGRDGKLRRPGKLTYTKVTGRITLPELTGAVLLYEIPGPPSP